jgi:hypothetical protein
VTEISEPQLRLGGAPGAGETVIEQYLGDARRDQRMCLGRWRDQILGRRDRLERQMRVAFGHARHQEQALGVDARAALRRHLAGAARNGADALAFHQHVAFERLGAARVPDGGASEECPVVGAAMHGVGGLLHRVRRLSEDYRPRSTHPECPPAQRILSVSASGA